MSETKSSEGRYNHQEISDDLDRLNRQLESMKSTLINTSVRAHLLEVDLATLYDPEVLESLRKADQDCEECTKAVYGDQASKENIDN